MLLNIGIGPELAENIGDIVILKMAAAVLAHHGNLALTQ